MPWLAALLLACPADDPHRRPPPAPSGDTSDTADTAPPPGPDPCNGKDDDRDGQVDEDPDRTFYVDADGDGFGDPTTGVATCDAGSGWTEVPGDCRDNDPRLAGRVDPDLHYVDASAEVGFDAIGRSWDGVRTCLRDQLAGGVAVADLDGDGHDDVFLPRTGLPHVLLRGDGRGHFASETLSLPPARASGATPVDLDGDGDLDLVVASVGREPAQALINDGDAHFTDEAAARGLALAGTYGECGDFMGTSAADVDGDGDLDLWIAGWEDRFFLGTRPRSRLYLNDGTGHFTDGTAAWGVDATWNLAAFGALFHDVDRDGDPDVLLVADWNGTTTYENVGGRFVERPAPEVFTDDNGMGADLADVDGDGDFDWFVTSIWSEPYAGCPSNPEAACSGNRLYRRDGDRWVDGTDLAGVREGQWDWGTSFFDLDADGAEDLVFTGGFDNALHRMAPGGLYRNRGDGTFEDRTCPAAFVWEGQGRGVLPFDPDEDGDADLIVTGRLEAPALYRLEGPPAHTLHLGLHQPGPNPFGVGAEVRVWVTPAGPPLLRAVRANPLYTSGRGPTVDVGLGAHAGPVDRVEVTWPDGAREVFPASRQGGERWTERGERGAGDVRAPHGARHPCDLDRQLDRGGAGRQAVVGDLHGERVGPRPARRGLVEHRGARSPGPAVRRGLGDRERGPGAVVDHDDLGAGQRARVGAERRDGSGGRGVVAARDDHLDAEVDEPVHDRVDPDVDAAVAARLGGGERGAARDAREDGGPRFRGAEEQRAAGVAGACVDAVSTSDELPTRGHGGVAAGERIGAVRVAGRWWWPPGGCRGSPGPRRRWRRTPRS